jgi:copper oxidase (laccase) domain-containing protein
MPARVFESLPVAARMAGDAVKTEYAQVAEWLMAADCKSAALMSYGGSNPPLCTIFPE